MAPILVTGATGTVGSAVLRTLTAKGAEARVAGRPGRPTRGMPDNVVAFDSTDPGTWSAAFKGVESRFLMRPPAIGKVRRDLLPAVAAARNADVRHVVFLSLQGAERNKIVPHAAVEKWLRFSGSTWTFVRASFFHQNLSTIHAADIRDRDEIIVSAGTAATAFVDAEDVGAVAAPALLDPAAHAMKAWTVTGPRALTYDQIADILSRELIRPIRYTRPGLLRYVRHAHGSPGMTWGMMVVTSAIYTTAGMGLAVGLTADVKAVLGRDPIDFTVFAHRQRRAWTHRLTAPDQA